MSRLMLPTFALAVFFVGATEFMLSTMLSPLASAFDTTPAHASWLVSSYAFSYAVAAPIFGFLSDRIDRRRLLLASLVLFAIDGFALTIAPSFSVAIALRIFGGLASAALIPTAFALISDIMPANRQSAAMGAVMVGMTFGIIAGPVIAGILTEALDWRVPFLVTAVGCLLTFAVAHRVIPQSTTRRTETNMRRFGWLAKGSIVRFWVAKGLWNGTAVAGFLLAGEVLRQRHDLSVGIVGTILFAFGLGLLVGNLSVGWAVRRFRGDERTLMAALLLLCVSVGTFMIAPLPLAGALVCLIVWGFSLGLAAPTSTSVLARRSEDDKGQVLAVSESFNNLTILAVLPIAALQLEAAGPAGTMMVLGITLAVALLLTAADLWS
ncbi:multidrug resistance protein [Rhizobium petrolearium]|uniref:MFS transporter n=1 Tax=Neorhizobium petrolearium TaxID=515361 RepID=UPI001FDB1CF4|nr:MFS transporter [Neorhizobium petrolearium]MBP1847582.1 multidrug resistance protein [Neorhizobium petrolearium]